VFSQSSLIQLEPVTSVLDVGGIVSTGWGNSVDSVADRAISNMGGQYEGRAAPLTKGRQPPTGNRSLSQDAAMGLRHKFHQFSPFGKRSARPVPLAAATSTSCHIQVSSK
jgi:hypothetical protein